MLTWLSGRETFLAALTMRHTLAAPHVPDREALGDDLVRRAAIEHALTTAAVGCVEAAQLLLQGTV